METKGSYYRRNEQNSAISKIGWRGDMPITCKGCDRVVKRKEISDIERLLCNDCVCEELQDQAYKYADGPSQHEEYELAVN